VSLRLWQSAKGGELAPELTLTRSHQLSASAVIFDSECQFFRLDRSLCRGKQPVSVGWRQPAAGQHRQLGVSHGDVDSSLDGRWSGY